MNTNLPVFRFQSAALVLACMMALFSCSKDLAPETNIGEVVNLVTVSSLRTQLNKATTLDDLSAEIKNAASVISTVLNSSEIDLYSKADLTAEAEALKSALTLSDDEITGLKANNANAYAVVVTRLSSVVSFASQSDL